jgi:purine catabolism regulator
MTDGVALRDALALPALRGVRVVAGAAGLGRRVRYVNVMEVPDILDWVKPDELLLTTAYPLRDDRSGLAELVPRLAERGLAGLAVKPARYIDALPAVMLESADRLEFPLLELPAEMALADIINAVLSLILNAQALRLEHSAAVHERFTRIVLGGGGLRDIAEVLSELVNRPSAIIDTAGLVVARSRHFPDELNLDNCAIQKVQAGPEHHAAVVVLAQPGELGEEDLMALEQAAMVTALRLVQERMASDADHRFQAVCLDELVTGHLTDRAVLRERSLAFGWDMSLPRAVMVADLETVNGRSFAELAGTPDESWASQRLADLARSVLGQTAIVWERSAGVAALVPGSDDALLETATRLQAAARTRLGGAEMSVGLGRAYADPLDLAESYSEAVRALRTARYARGDGQIASFARLGLERLLLSCSDVELRAFVATTLGPLVDYETAHPGANLSDTLRAFLACNRTVAGCARGLYVHYNTVRYRLDRLEALLGPFVDDPEHCLRLELAFRVNNLSGSARR